MDEKRKFKRVPGKFVVQYSELSLSEKARDVFLSQLVNISASGLLFESAQAFAVDTVLKLELKMDRWQKFSSDFYKYDQTSVSEPFVAVGKVVRVESMGKGKYLIGVFLTSVYESHRDALKKYIESLSEAK
ncbi:MAG TPA: PilZ domain-containing protein [Elusimicrobiota bacterium]|nr:PilZ domain-containing protein [Elusimicrobiota bacterium]